MSGITNISTELFETSLDNMRLKMTKDEKDHLIANFNELVKAQLSAEELVEDSDRLNELPLLHFGDGREETVEDRKERVRQIVEMTGQGVMAFYDTITNPDHSAVAERILSDKSHRDDLNKILEVSANIAGNPRQVSPNDVVEMDRLLKKKSRDFGMGRMQIFMTVTAVAAGLSQLGPVLGAALMGPGAAKAGAVINGAFSTVGAGIKSGAIYLANNPITVALVAQTAAFATYVGVREYNTKTRKAARADAKVVSDEAKEERKNAAAQLKIIEKATLGSDALNKVMLEYHNKIEGKGYINATVNAVLGGSSTLREARRVLGEKMSAMFDTTVPYLPSPYDLYKGDFKQLRTVLNAPYYAASAAVTGGAALGSMAYNAIKGTKKHGDEPKSSHTYKEAMIASLASMQHQFSTGMSALGQSLDANGRAAISNAVIGATQGFKEIQKALRGEGDVLASLAKVSKAITYDVGVISKALTLGTYKMAVGASMGLGATLKALAALGKSMNDGFQKMGQGIQDGLQAGVDAIGKPIGKAMDELGNKMTVRIKKKDYELYKGVKELAKQDPARMPQLMEEMKEVVKRRLTEDNPGEEPTSPKPGSSSTGG